MEEVETGEKKRVRFRARVINQGEGFLDVVLKREIVEGRARVFVENGEEKKEIEFDTREESSFMSVPSLESVYSFEASPWERVEELSPPVPELQVPFDVMPGIPEISVIVEEKEEERDTETPGMGAGPVLERWFARDPLEVESFPREEYEVDLPPVPEYVPDESIEPSGRFPAATVLYREEREDEGVARESYRRGESEISDTVEARPDHGVETREEIVRRKFYGESNSYGVSQQVTIEVPDGLSGSAKEVVQELMERGHISGRVERETYTSTESFRKPTGEEVRRGEETEDYLVEIEGVDRYGNEFFINGELAEDSIDSYELGPGDRIDVVEAEYFRESMGDYCGGGLELEDITGELEEEPLRGTLASAETPTTYQVLS